MSDQPLVSGLVVDPEGAQMWVKDQGNPIHVCVRAGEPYARVYINGVDVTPPRGVPFPGTLANVAAFDRVLTHEELEELRDA